MKRLTGRTLDAVHHSNRRDARDARSHRRRVLQGVKQPPLLVWSTGAAILARTSVASLLPRKQPTHLSHARFSPFSRVGESTCWHPHAQPKILWLPPAISTRDVTIGYIYGKDTARRDLQ